MTTFADVRPYFPLLIALPAVPAQELACAPAQEPDPKAPKTLGEAWTEAQRLAKACKAPLVAFVLPPADAKVDPAAVAAAVARAKKAWPMKGAAAPDVEPKTARELFLLQFQLLRAAYLGRERDPAAVRAAGELELLFHVAVPVVAEAAACGAKPGETVVVVEPDGGKRRGFAVDLADPVALAAAVRPRVTSPEALAPRRAQVPPELQKAIEELRALQIAPGRGDAEAKAAMELHRRLREALPAAAPAMVTEVQLDVDGEKGPVVVLAPDRLLQLLGSDAPTLGTAIAASWDPCPPCGMAAVPLALRSTLKLLAQ